MMIQLSLKQSVIYLITENRNLMPLDRIFEAEVRK